MICFSIYAISMKNFNVLNWLVLIYVFQFSILALADSGNYTTAFALWAFILVALPLCIMAGLLLCFRNSKILVILSELVVLALVLVMMQEPLLLQKVAIKPIILSQFFIFAPILLKDLIALWKFDRFSSEKSKLKAIRNLILVLPVCLYTLIHIFIWFRTAYMLKTGHQEVTQEFANFVAQKKIGNKKIIADKLYSYNHGEANLACILVLEDPQVNIQIFYECKKQIEAAKTRDEKWEKLSPFLSAGNGFMSWYNDEVDDKLDVTDRNWSKKISVIPNSEQAWFIKTFFETWLNLNNDQIMKTVFGLNEALRQMLVDQVWNQDSKSVLNQELRQRLIDRIKNATVASAEDTSMVIFRIESFETDVEYFNNR